MDRESLSLFVSRNIAAAMDQRGITAADLARQAGINTSGVYDILTGRSRSPRLDTVCKIAAALRVPVIDLLEEQEARDLRREILNAAAMLPEADQRRLLATARAWAASD